MSWNKKRKYEINWFVISITNKQDNYPYTDPSCRVNFTELFSYLKGKVTAV